jgi:two-component system, OmpR family, sensor kinase
MLHSIQGRIVLGSIAIAVIVLAVLGVVVGEQLRHVAGASIANQTREQLQSYVADLRNQPDEQPDEPSAGEWILVLSPSGEAAVDTLPAGIRDAVVKGGVGVARTQAGGVGYVTVGETVTNALGRWRLWAVRDSVEADATVRGVARVLILVVPVLLLLVALGSWLLVRIALRPVRRLRTAADRIGTSGGSGRLPDPQGRDEIAALSATLNRFLEAQQHGVERERRMIADASHELRTPLAVLTAQLEIAHRQFGDAAALERTVLAVESDVGALARLATQLLELSRLDSGPGGHGRDEVPLRALVTELMNGVDRARSLAPEGVLVDFAVDAGLDEDARVPLSAIAFGRIVDNLVMNAVHATRAGAVEVRLAPGAGRLVMSVTDTGTGVAPEFLPRAFERFARSDESRATQVQGSGLGLALVGALVAAVGGDVVLANRPDGGGAVATVSVPLSSPEPQG